jgi:3-oxoacyl-[acyl-carrier protein] reductase
MDLKNKSVLVTAASRGIGKAIALKLGALGAKVAVNYVSSEASALEVVEQIKASGGEAFAVKADVSKSAEVAEMFAKVEETFGTVDVLVNNAGIVRDGLILRMSDEDFDAVIDTNVKGVFYCCRAAAKIMVKKRCGNIINIASVVGFSGNAGQVNYTAAKGAVIAMTKTLARELGGRNIRVNAVAPGFIKTDMTKSLEGKMDEITAGFVFKYPGEPEDIANAVAYLAGDDSRYVTGQTLHVNGGSYM